MRNDFVALILTHGRPDNIETLKALERFGYTGRIFLVVDDEDTTLPAYRERYGDRVLTFSKREIAERFDEGDNFQDRRSVFYARNAAWDLARSVGARYFVQLDDDYFWFHYRFDGAGLHCCVDLHSLDWLFERLVEFLAATPCASVAISQGADHMGGGPGLRSNGTRRKAMNSFICDVERPFSFVGRINEDVNTYTCEQRRGLLFLTVLAAQLVQVSTQASGGGMTELYLDVGTYVKSFYSVMYAPSCVSISVLKDHGKGQAHARLHHDINWRRTAPLILREGLRKHA